MSDISFHLAEDHVSVELSVNDLAPPLPNKEELQELFNQSEFSACKLLDEKLDSAIEALSKEIESQTAELPLCFPIAIKRDASLEINITEDKMQATAHLVTAQGGVNLTQEEMIESVVESGCCEGVNKQAIIDLYEEASSAPAGTEFNKLIAKGLAIIEPIATQYEYLVIPLQDRVLVPQEQDDGSVNVRDYGKIETTNKGEELVRLIPAKTGQDGYDVFANKLLADPPDNQPLTPGPGTQVSSDDPNLLIASQDGVPYRSENGMQISEALILESVNLEVGNIDFEGTVIANGDVAPNMTIKATDDVIVNGFAESCTIEAGGSITVCNGVLGQEIKHKNQTDISFSTKLIAGQDISIRHAQSARLQAKGTITVSSQLLHSHVTADEGLIVGGEGQAKPKIIGGVIHAPSISAGEIGTAASSKVLINLSSKVRSLEKKLAEQRTLKVKDMETQNQVNLLLKQLKSNQSSSPTIEKLCAKVMQGINLSTSRIVEIKKDEESLLSEIKKAKSDIHVTVHGRIFPGVEFTICNDRYRTRNEIPNCIVRFRNKQIHYDKAASK
ncbi:MAG: FapA family protein [Candidatus Polarisedimenticolaceae bacterium]|nr:FapA family protein [Candidatus Polarisedimenticolaceae bacterium]